MVAKSSRARVVLAGGRETMPVGAGGIEILIDSAATDGRLVLVEEHLPPGPASPPSHVHRTMDHTFYVTSGTVRFTAGDHTTDVGGGGAVFVPRGTAHTFQNASDTENAAFIEFDAPGRFDSYFRELSSLLTTKGFAEVAIRELQARYDTWPPS